MKHPEVPRYNAVAADSARVDMAGPVATLQDTCGVLLVPAAVLALVAVDVGVVLTALDVTGLVPIALGALVRASRRSEREEDAAIVPPVAAMSWQPIVLITSLRELIFQVGPLTLTAGVVTTGLAIFCSLPNVPTVPDGPSPRHTDPSTHTSPGFAPCPKRASAGTPAISA
jgi:hypothetical protein